MRILNSRELSSAEVRALAYCIAEWDDSIDGDLYEYFLEPISVYQITYHTIIEFGDAQWKVVKAAVEAAAELELHTLLRILNRT